MLAASSRSVLPSSDLHLQRRQRCLMAPIALQDGHQMGCIALSFAATIAIAASAAFCAASLVAGQHLVLGPNGFKFMDFRAHWRAFTLLVMVVSVIIPWFFPVLTTANDMAACRLPFNSPALCGNEKAASRQTGHCAVAENTKAQPLMLHGWRCGRAMVWRGKSGKRRIQKTSLS